MKIQATVINTLQNKDPTHPSVITVLTSPNISTRFVKCFTRKLAFVLNKSVFSLLSQDNNLVFGFPTHPKEIYPETFRHHSITIIRNDIERYFKFHGKALIVHDITEFEKEEDLMVFHGICDNYHAVDPRATIIFPVRIPANMYKNMEPSVASTANLVLTKAWSNILVEDSVPALVARVADTVILLEKEDECRDSRMYENEDGFQTETNHSFPMSAVSLNNTDNFSCTNALPFYFQMNKINDLVPSKQAVRNSTLIQSKVNLDSKPAIYQSRTDSNENIFNHTDTPNRLTEMIKDFKNTLSQTKPITVEMELNLTTKSTHETNKDEIFNDFVRSSNESKQLNAKSHTSTPPKRNTQQRSQKTVKASQSSNLKTPGTMIKPVKIKQKDSEFIKKTNDYLPGTAPERSPRTIRNQNGKHNSKIDKADKISTLQPPQPYKHIKPRNKNMGKRMKNEKLKDKTLDKNDKKLRTDGIFSKYHASKYDQKPGYYKTSQNAKYSNKNQKSRNSRKNNKQSNRHKTKANKKRSRNKN